MADDAGAAQDTAAPAWIAEMLAVLTRSPVAQDQPLAKCTDTVDIEHISPPGGARDGALRRCRRNSALFGTI